MTDARLVPMLREWARHAPRQLGTTARALARGIEARAAKQFEPLGAVDRWRAEMRGCARALGTIDALHRAACYEIRAREAFSDGLQTAAARDLDEAARYLLTYLDALDTRADLGARAA